jgi:hypothetical protein
MLVGLLFCVAFVAISWVAGAAWPRAVLPTPMPPS